MSLIRDNKDALAFSARQTDQFLCGALLVDVVILANAGVKADVIFKENITWIDYSSLNLDNDEKDLFKRTYRPLGSVVIGVIPLSDYLSEQTGIGRRPSDEIALHASCFKKFLDDENRFYVDLLMFSQPSFDVNEYLISKVSKTPNSSSIVADLKNNASSHRSFYVRGLKTS